MSKTKSSKGDVAKVSKKDSKKTVPAVKEGRVTKPAQTPKAKSKEIAKSVAKEVKKSKKSKKEPTPEPESDSESASSESESESDSSSSASDSEVETKAPAKAPAKAKANGAAKPAAADSSSDSDSSESESESDEEAAAPKPNGAKANGTLKAPADEDSDSESDSSESESDEEEKPAVKAAKAKASSDEEMASGSDSDSDSDSDSSASEEEEAPTKKRKAEADAEPAAKKNKTEEAGDEGIKNLFVGNLSWNIDEDWLAREFESFGEITGCRIITDRETGRAKGFGYVEFSTSEAAAKAKEQMHQHEVDGRALNVDFSTPRQNNNAGAKSNDRANRFGDKRSNPTNTLFLGNLSFDSTNESVHELFSAHGEISRVSIPTDRETGNPKGFGYVDFNTTEEATAALEALNGAELEGRSIRVDYAQPREDNGGGGRGGRGGGRGRGDRGGRGGGRGFGGGRGGGRGFGGGRGGGRGGSTNRGGFGDFQGSKMKF